MKLGLNRNIVLFKIGLNPQKIVYEKELDKDGLVYKITEIQQDEKTFSLNHRTGPADFISSTQKQEPIFPYTYINAVTDLYYGRESFFRLLWAATRTELDDRFFRFQLMANLPIGAVHRQKKDLLSEPRNVEFRDTLGLIVLQLGLLDTVYGIELSGIDSFPYNPDKGMYYSSFRGTKNDQNS